jgi:MFS family permease
MVGVYVSAEVIGQAGGNLLWGAVGDRYGYRRVLALLAVAGVMAPLLALIVPADETWLFVGVFVLVGSIFRGVEMAVGNFLLELAPGQVRPTCVALLNTLIAPLFLLPMLGGWLVGVSSYAVVFLIAAAVNAVGWGLTLRLRDPRLHGDEVCIY